LKQHCRAQSRFRVGPSNGALQTLPEFDKPATANVQAVLLEKGNLPSEATGKAHIVGIHAGDEATARLIQASVQGRDDPQVPFVPYEPERQAPVYCPRYYIYAVVYGPVIDGDDLEGLQTAEIQAAQRAPQPGSRVEEREHNGYSDAVCGSHGQPRLSALLK
jgi:hypothetical protein